VTPSPAYSRPDVRAVLDDATLEAGRVPSWGWLMRRAQIHTADDADAADDDADATDDDATATAAATAAADDDATAAADAADADDDATATAAATAADDATEASNHNRYWKGAEMREGLVLIQVPGRYWGVTRVGWARRIEGDEWELHGATTVVRTGAPVQLDVLAARGPDGHRCSPVAEVPELLHRFSPRRVLVANVEAWAKHVGPRPEWMP
jgi:hypothetical protein